MDIDPSDKVETLRSITAAGPLSSSVAKLSGSSRGIPTQKDFYFYTNFEKFKNPVKEIDSKSKTLLKNVGTSSQLWGKSMTFPEDLDYDDLELYDWLVNVNDEIFEKVDASLHEFRNLRKIKEEGSGVKLDMDSESGFQVVCGKKNKRRVLESNNAQKEVQGVQVAAKVKPKIPFHIATIPRPQDEYKIIVNNSNQPFEHVWLQKSEDGARFIHPLVEFSVMDFVDTTSIADMVPSEPLPLECTPFTLVEDIKDLKRLAAKLHSVDEFAVDLEHNQYRSFQGLTCLMQISTRTEDFVIDTLRLRIHIGPYLREVFKDPTKRKVMHGADRDIMWLQRDFGIYVCNLFDTGQASRVLKMDRHSLEYLLFYFCGVIANKEYQNADWRLRPLPDEMLRYAREDTHYLLHISDMMKRELLSAAAGSESSDGLLMEVYKRSYDICMQLYEKEILTDSSYLHIYGLQGSGLNAQQVAVVSGLCEWRDVVARAEDESTGYVLPNKTLLEIAKQMPLTTSKLRRVVKSKHPYVERNLGSIVSIIRLSVQNSAAFEAAAKKLKERLSERASESTSVSEVAEGLPHEAPGIVKNAADTENNCINNAINDEMPGRCVAPSIKVDGANCQDNFPKYPDKAGTDSYSALSSKATQTLPERIRETGATVPVLKKPNRAFGALLGASSKRKLHADKKEPEDIKLEQIKSAVNLPFHSFAGNKETVESAAVVEPSKSLNNPLHSKSMANSSKEEDIIPLRSGSDVEESGNRGTLSGNDLKENSDSLASSGTEGEEPVSLSDLSSSFQKCFRSPGERRKTNLVEKSQDKSVVGGGFFPQQLKPFDYDSTEDIIFGGGKPGAVDDEDGSVNNRVKKGSRKNDAVARRDERTKELAPGGRRHAFPPSGNRSATFG